MAAKVVIVGRPNVGKSSLLNMLAGRRVSIVDAMPGVTRDRVSTHVTLRPTQAGRGPMTIELVDTGGHGIDDTQQLTAEVERQIAAGVAEADLILFVVDAQSGLMPLDHEVAQLLRSSGGAAAVLLVANKVDGQSHEPAAFDAMQLGFGEPRVISAANSYNKHEFIDAVAAALYERGFEDDDDQALPPGDHDDDETSDPRAATGPLIAIAGKRNAGKSTLVNALAGAQRVIVSEIEGTTRDSIDVRIEFEGRLFTAIDTAGVRKRKSIKQDIEFYSHHRALRSIRRADVVMLLIDASVPVSQVDSQLAQEVVRHHKPCVIVINKWDLAEADYTQEQYLEYLDKALRGLSFAPLVFISAVNEEGLRDVVAMALNLYQQASDRVSTGELNRIVQRLLAERTPVSKVGKRPKLYYVTQLATHPPTIGLFVNRPELFDDNYQRFFLNRLRDEVPFSEVPIKLVIRPRQRAGRQAAEVEPIELES